MLAAAVVGILITSLFASFSLVQVVWLWTLAGVRAAPGSQVRDRAITGLQVPAALLGGTFVVVAAMLAVSDGAWANLARAVQQKEAGRALQEYETAARWGAGFAGYELYASRQLASLGTSLGKSPEAAAAWTQAAVAAERAEKQGEEPFSAAYQSAVLAIARGDLELSERKALLATQMAPKWYKPYLLRAQLMAATGRQREAAEQQDVAIRLGAPKPERR